MTTVNPVHEANIFAVAAAAGYIDDGRPLPRTYRDVICLTVSRCQDVLEDLYQRNQSPEEALEEAFGIGLAQRQPEIEEHIRSILVNAGYRNDGSLPETHRRLVLMAVNRCLEVLRSRQPADLDPAVAIETAFGFVSRLLSRGAGLCYTATLKGADHVIYADQRTAEQRYLAVIESRIGKDAKGIEDAYEAWAENPESVKGKVWAQAADEATKAALAPVGGVEGAYFEMMFINDI